MLKCIHASKCASLGAISSRCLSLLRKVNANMDSAKYKSCSIHDIEMTSECAVFPQKEYIYMHDLKPCHNSKNTRTFLEFKEKLF